MRPRQSRYALLAALLAAGGALFGPATLLRAGVVGTPHDFSPTGPYTKGLGAGGACSPCHIPHGSKDTILWPRRLGDSTDGYRKYLNKADGSGDNNYLYPVTLQCYDCHDYAGDPGFSGGEIAAGDEKNILDNNNNLSDPPKGSFKEAHRPQDIAFGMRMPTAEPPPGGYAGNWTDDGPGGTVAGYFENYPPNNSPFRDDDSTTGRFGVGDPSGTPNVGGHYFRSADPYSGGTPALRKGDKIPCSDCHDPHDYTIQAFIKQSVKSLPGATGLTIEEASDYMSNKVTDLPIPRQRYNPNSRHICIACHTLAGETNVTYNNINSNYSSQNIVQRPVNVAEHLSGSNAPCTQCHSHNNVGASCSQCHGYPPSRSAALPYPASFTPSPNPLDNDSHPRHYGKASGAGATVYEIPCETCHYLTTGAGAVVGVHQDNRVSVILMGKWARNPLGGGGAWDNTNYYNRRLYPGGNPGVNTGSLDNSSALPTGWGGTDNTGSYSGWNSCRNVYCHSAGKKSMADGDFRLPVWNAGRLGCNACHGPGTDNATSNGINWGMPNYANGGPGDNSANSHSAHVVSSKYECYLCHYETVTTATGANRAIRTDLTPVRHVDGLRQVVFDGTRAVATQPYDNATKTCYVTCHGGNAVVWGSTSLSCAECHVRTGDVADFGNGTPGSMTGNNITAGIDNNEWFYSGHGKQGGTYDCSANVAAAFGGANPCLYCHDSAVDHWDVNNVFRLKDQTGVSGYAGLSWNATCQVCHSKTTTPPGYNYPGGPETKAATTASRVDTAHFGTKHGGLNDNGGAFCFDCHDPHGDRNSSGSGNIFMIGRRVSRSTDNVSGIPKGGNDNSYRPATTFTGDASGANYADNVAPYDGICQVCHEAASGLKHYTNTGQIDPHFTTKCTTCHLHDANFKGLGGPDVGQYFDNLSSNYPDASRHPLRGLTTGDNSLRFEGKGSENCLACHYGAITGKTSDECLMCHFENVGPGNAALDGTRHMDKVIQLASLGTPTPQNELPGSAYTIGTIQQYDLWCLQCHGSESGITLGGISPLSSRRTVIDPAAFANGRHRANTQAGGPVGCIYCHQPHGRSNARIVRENPANRASAGATPMRFGVYPSPGDNVGSYTGSYRATLNENFPYRARTDNTLPNVFADADDDQSFCTKACHRYKLDDGYAKDKMIKRVEGTGDYVLAGTKKIFIIDGLEYTVDNVSTRLTRHVHPNGDVISTDNMVFDYALRVGVSGPGRYKYPGTNSAIPPTGGDVNSVSVLPFFPDFEDTTRDFGNAWNELKFRIKYRYTCSTCHNPHGTTLPNALNSNTGYPDLRQEKMGGSALCRSCHR